MSSGSARARAVEHVGESRVALRAGSRDALFAEAARVVARACGRAHGAPREWEPVALHAHDDASLLVDWMNELIGRSEVSGCAYRDVRALHVVGGEGGAGDGGARLSAEVRGTPVARWRSPLKAATHHGLRVQRLGDRWAADVVLDV